jgi:two-component system, OmpR family, sensor kinase
VGSRGVKSRRARNGACSKEVDRDPGTSSSRRELKWGLALISLALIAHLTVISVWTESTTDRAQQLYRDSLTSVELITRIGRDLDQQHILLDVHIIEAEPSGMEQIERELDRASADLSQAKNAYTPLVELPGEEATWREARQLIARFDTAKIEVLALSRKNLDTQARARMTANFDDYSKLQQRIARLIAIERGGAEGAVARIRTLRRINVAAMLSTGIVVLVVVLVLGRRAIHRITAYEEQIVAYARTLEERNRELDAFAGRIAHDLLGPVASLRLSADLLSSEAGAPAPGGHQSTRDRLLRSIEQMTTMIEDLLAFARADTAARSVPSDPAAVAAKVGDDFLVRYGDQASLHAHVEAACVAYREGLLRQVLWNLVENSVKYRRSDVDAEISISGHVAAGFYELRVSDNGPGVQPEDAVHIFEPLFRADPTRHIPGTGLGLSIVKRIVEGGGGRISLQSQPGHGATFVLRLPLVLKSTDVTEAA